MHVEKSEFEARALAAGNRLYRIAKAMVIREADCEDAVQEALVKAWMHLPHLKEAAYFETWLCRILINECKQLLRRQGRRPEGALPPTLPAPPPPDPALWEALSSLPVQYRVPLILHHAEGYGIQETARMMGLPAGAVKWRIHQGKKQLEDLLAKEVGQCTNET